MPWTVRFAAGSGCGPGKGSYYFQKPVWEKKLLHLEPSDAPCPVRQGSAKPEFPDENGFTVALSYEGKSSISTGSTFWPMAGA